MRNVPRTYKRLQSVGCGYFVHHFSHSALRSVTLHIFGNMTFQSKVGNRRIYEDGDQRNVPRSVIEEEKKLYRFHEGKEGSHTTKFLVILTILQRQKEQGEENGEENKEELQSKLDPTLPVSTNLV